MKPTLILSFFFLLNSSLPQANTLFEHAYFGIMTENIRGIQIQFFDDGSSYSHSNPARIAASEKIIKEAYRLSGTPYHAGGNAPETGFDCSGFVRYVFNQSANISLPATARAIAKIGKSIDKKDLQAGDLVFFNTLKLPFTHVAIYIGGNQFIHAPNTGSVVRVDQMDSAYWSRHFNGAKRIAID